MNLIKKVSLNGTTLVNYSYLADGTGLEYRGSLQDQANRYRYNGKEEQSLFGSAYSDYGARQYSASTGRWLSMDPLSENYYSVSPYTFCANNPVNFVDPDGRRLYFVKDSSYEFKQKFMQTLVYMIFKGTAENLLRLHLTDREYYICKADRSKENRFEVKDGIRIIYWDPNHIVGKPEGIWRSPATTLAHEAAHAARYEDSISNGTVNQYILKTQDHTDPQYDTIEDKEVITTIEQEVARKHGEIEGDQVTRTDHRGSQLPGDVINKDPWEIQKIISEHNKLLR